MADEILISDIVDVSKTGKQIESLLTEINKIDTAIQGVNQKGVQINGANGLRELKASIDALNQSVGVLASSMSGSLNKSVQGVGVSAQSTAKSFKDAEGSIVSVRAKIKDLTTEYDNLSKAERNSAKGTGLQKQLADERAVLSQLIKERDAAFKAMQDQQEKQLDSTIKISKAEQDKTNALKTSAAEEQKIASQITNEYAILSKAYAEAALKAKNYALTLGESHPITVQATQDAKEMGSLLTRLDASVGQYGRNVGNYSGAFGNLRFQMQQVLRETPSLAVGLNQYFLAISNNIPMLADAINKAKAANLDLAASGKETVPVFSQIIKGLFSWQTAVVAIISIITVFGDKIIKGIKDLFGWESAQEKAARSMKQLTQALHEQAQQFDDFKTSVEKAVDRTIAKLKELGANQNELNNVRLSGLALVKGAAEKDAKENIAALNDQIKLYKELKKFAYEAQTTQKSNGDKITEVKPSGFLGEFFRKNPIQSQLADINITDGDVTNLKKAENIVNELKRLSNDKAFEAMTDSQKEAFKAIQLSADNILKTVTTAYNLGLDIDQNLADKQAQDTKDARDATRQRLEDEVNTQADIIQRNKKAIIDSIEYEKQVKAGNFDALRRQVVAERDFELNTEKDKVAAINKVRELELARPENTEADKIRINANADKEIAAAKLTSREKEKIRKEAASKLFDIDEEERKRNIEATKQSFVAIKQLQVDLLDSLSGKSDFNTDDRLKFLQQSFDAQKSIIDKEHQALVESKKFTFLTIEEKAQAETEYETKLIELNRKTQDKITEILKDSLDQQVKLREEEFQRIDALYKQLNVNSGEQYTDEVIALNKALKEKTISYEKYLKDRRELDFRYSKDGLKNTISDIEAKLPSFKGAQTSFLGAQQNVNFLQGQLTQTEDPTKKKKISDALEVAKKQRDIAQKNYDEQLNLEQQLSDAKRKLSDGDLQHDEANLAKRLAKTAEILGQLAQLANEVGNFGAAIIQRRIDLIEQEKDALEERYNREQDVIKQAYDTQVHVTTERDRKLLESDARYRAKKHQLDEQEKAEKIKQAQFEKDSAVAAIILRTAQAVVSALAMTPPNVPLSIAAGVIGAAELATAIATPLPRFYKGKNATDNYEGLAWVDDGGKPELIVREDGSMEVGTDKPRITYLGKDDVVLPDADKAIKEIKHTEVNNSKVIEKSRVEKVMPDMRKVAWKATVAAAKPNVTVNTSFNSDEIVSELKINNRLLKGIKNKPIIKLNNRSPLDDWMNGGINTNDLFK